MLDEYRNRFLRKSHPPQGNKKTTKAGKVNGNASNKTPIVLPPPPPHPHPHPQPPLKNSRLPLLTFSTNGPRGSCNVLSYRRAGQQREAACVHTRAWGNETNNNKSKKNEGEQGGGSTACSRADQTQSVHTYVTHTCDHMQMFLTCDRYCITCVKTTSVDHPILWSVRPSVRPSIHPHVSLFHLLIRRIPDNGDGRGGGGDLLGLRVAHF